MVGNLLGLIMETFPVTEVWIRKLYWNFKFIHENAKKVIRKKKKPIQIVPGLYERVVKKIKNLGIQKGDILIVHSSMDGLVPTGATPKQYIDLLLELVGEQGTLVFPAFPVYRNKNAFATNLLREDENEIRNYNPKSLRIWTGLMAVEFLRYPGVERSRFPDNPLAARGFHAKEMMADNLKGDLAHGKHSAWAYCIDHNAKILYIGVPAYHSLTIMHVAEDLLDERWPVKDWYRVQNYIINDNKETISINIRQRKLKWAIYLTEYYNARLLKKEKLLTKHNIDNIDLEFIADSKKLTGYLIGRALKRKIFYKIPRRYIRKNS